MISKSKIITIVDLSYWGLILITATMNLITENNITSTHFIIILWDWLLDIILESIMVMIQYWGITVLYAGIRIAILRFFTERLDEIDIEKNKDYYRDIIKKYSPAVLNYVDNFTVDKCTVFSTLMNLELKGIINSKLEIINTDISKLDKNEEYIYSNLKNINLFKFENAIIEDCIKYNLLRKKDGEKFTVGKKYAMFIVILVICIILMPIVEIMGLKRLTLTLAVVLLIVVFGFVICTYAFKYYMIAHEMIDKINPYIRSRKAQEINEKLEGLKNYLQDYSFMEDKTQKELILWEDYLIYSVMFDQNKKIIREYQEKIDRT